MNEKDRTTPSREAYREYLKENSRHVNSWPDWMKDGARGVSVANAKDVHPNQERCDKKDDPPEMIA